MMEALEDPDERFLSSVFGVLPLTEHAVAETENLPLKPLDRIHGPSQVRQPRLQQGFLGPVRDHNAQPCRSIESQMRAYGLRQGFDHHRFTRIGLLGAVVVVLDQNYGMLGRQSVAEPAVSDLHRRQALRVF